MAELESDKRINKIKWVLILNVFVIITLTAITGWFVYTNIYQTIGKAQTLLLVKANPQFEPIDFRLFDEVEQSWNEKYNDISPTLTRDPFYDIVVATSTPEEIISETTDTDNQTTVQSQL